MQTSDELIELFDSCFAEQYQTRLYAGADEPLYQPGDSEQLAKIFFRKDYFASALHEIAHWCIAGEARRAKTDYGYWYEADGRNAEQQKAFYQVEVKPQALEWCFSVACNYPFRISLDNVEAVHANWIDWEQQANEVEQFKNNCFTQVQEWLLKPNAMPPRGMQFVDTLTDFYRSGNSISLNEFKATAI